MKSDRRTFLKTTGIVGGALLTGVAAKTGVDAGGRANGRGRGGRRPDDLLHLAAWRRLRPGPQDRARHPRRGGGRAGLQGRRADDDHSRARRAGRPRRPQAPRRQGDAGAFRCRGQGQVRPVRHQPGEDRLHRPQLPQARGRDRQPGAEAADPVQQVQHGAQLPRRRDRGVQGEGGEVRLRGRARDRHRPHARATSSEADAPAYIFGYCTGNDFTARDLQSRSSQWMLGKTLDGSGADRPLARHRRSGRRRQPQDRMPGQRRGAPVLQHQRHGVQLQAARQLHLRAT